MGWFNRRYAISPTLHLVSSLQYSVSSYWANGIGKTPAVILRSAATKNPLWLFDPAKSCNKADPSASPQDDIVGERH
jgi:hypothetical protein